MNPLSNRLLLPLAVAGALALPAAATAYTTIPVPAGQIQHTVWDTTVSGTKATKTHQHQKHELWLGANGGRSVFTDADTGKLLDECVSDTSSTRCWDSDENQTDIFEPTLGLLGLSWAQLGENSKEVIDAGRYAFSSDTTFMGQPAQLYKATTTSDADDNDIDTMIVEPGTLYPWQYEETDQKGPAVLHSMQTVTERDLVAPSSVSFTLSSHPGAKVVDHRHTSAQAAKKHKKKKVVHHKKPVHHKAKRTAKRY